MKRTTLLLSLFFCFSLTTVSIHSIQVKATTSSDSATFTSKTWTTNSQTLSFTSLADGSIFSLSKGVQVYANKTGSFVSTSRYEDVTAMEFNLSKSVLGRATLHVYLIDNSSERLYGAYNVSNNLEESFVIHMDGYGSGQVKIVLGCTSNSVFFKGLTLYYGDPALNDAHAYATTLLNETSNKAGTCQSINWWSLEEAFDDLSTESKVYFAHDYSDALLSQAMTRYRYLLSHQGWTDFMDVGQALSKISYPDQMRKIEIFIPILLAFAIGVYIYIQHYRKST